MEGSDTPVNVWGKLALRQQDLVLPTETARAALVEEARMMASQQLSAAAELFAEGKQSDAVELVRKLVKYGGFIGNMLELSGWDGDKRAGDLAEQYLGALSLSPELESFGCKVSSLVEGLNTGDESLLAAMLALSAPGLDDAKKQYRAQLEEQLAKGGVTGSSTLHARASELGLTPAVQQKLALEAYYGWLSDLSENVDRSALERCQEVRQTLRLEDSSVGELYTNTAIDEVVLVACLEQLFENDVPPPPEAQQWVTMIERLMLARPGVAAAVLEG